MAAARFSINNSTNIVITAGPYIAYGIGGKTKIDTFGDIAKGNMGCERFDAGVGLGVALEYKKIIFGLESKLGLVNVGSHDLKDVAQQLGLGDFSSKNISACFTIGYKF